MFNFTLKFTCLAFLGICFMFSGPVSPVGHCQMPGHSHNERIHNGTGQPATNLEKWFEGDVIVIDWGSNRFNSFSYIYNADEDETKLRWYDGLVVHCDTANVCFRTLREEVTYKYWPRWTYEIGDSVLAGPALSAEFVDYPKGFVDLIISNTALDGEDITIQIIQVGVVDTLFTLNQLFFDSLESVSWISEKSNVSLPLDSSIIFAGYKVPSGGGVVYRAKLYMNSDPSNVVEDVGQFATEKDVPTLTQWGLIILVALLIVSTVFVLLKRKKAVIRA